MSDLPKTIKIRELPQTSNVTDTDIFIIEDGTTTYKITVQNLIEYFKNNEAIKDFFISKEAINVSIAPLDENLKVPSDNISFGITEGTVFDGGRGKALEESLDIHMLDENNPHKLTTDTLGIGRVENKSSDDIRSELTKGNVTNALGYTPYTPNEVDNKLSALETKIDWKESVDTYDDIATHYPEPEDGWTVNVKDTDYTYRFNGDSWVVISANAIPKATENVDGLLSKEDYTKYNDSYVKRHTHDNKSILDTITSALLNTWNTAVTSITQHISNKSNPHNVTKQDIGLGKVGNFYAVSTEAQILSEAEKQQARENIGAGSGTSSFSGNYNDLSGKPTSMKNPAALTFTGGVTESYDGSSAKTVAIPTTLPASDVSAWAKAGTKPSYSKSEVGLGNVPNVTTNDQTPTFAQASARTNITSGEKLSVIFGKIMKWFADLKTIAFTGSYNDLSNKPTIPASVRVKGNAETSYHTGDVNLTPANIGAAPSSHTHDAGKITAGTLGGAVVANATAVTNLSTKQVRNIYAGTAALTDGSSALPTGDIYIQYE